jgi:hypothetical protein
MEDESGKKTTFDFYNGYLTVVYGLLVSNGLGYVVKFTSTNTSHSWESVDALLFLGTFLTSLHFWFVCATVDDLSGDFYRALAGAATPVFELFVLLDIAVSTILAGLLLAMFDAIPGERFFLWFLLAGGMSLLYDLYSSGLVSLARWLNRDRVGQQRDAIEKYRRRIGSWIRADFVFVTASGAMYLLRTSKKLCDSMALGSVFLAFTICLLLMDVWAFRGGRRPPFAIT